jgi:hypothetical protein
MGGRRENRDHRRSTMEPERKKGNGAARRLNKSLASSPLQGRGVVAGSRRCRLVTAPQIATCAIAASLLTRRSPKIKDAAAGGASTQPEDGCELTKAGHCSPLSRQLRTRNAPTPPSLVWWTPWFRAESSKSEAKRFAVTW